MNFILEVANLAGSIAAFIDYPFIAIGLGLLLALTRQGHEMGKKGKAVVIGFLVIGFFAYVIDVASHLDWVKNLYWDRPLIQVWQKEFKNQTVTLDGYEYVECSFENVTFQYEGTGPTRLTLSKITGATRLSTHNLVAGQMMQFMRLVGPGIEIKAGP
jgi:hypothetical protein